MQNQSFMNNSFQQSQFGTGAQPSQYQGKPKFQPTGFVQSMYGQNQNQIQSQASQGFGGFTAGQFQPSGAYSGFQQQSQESFHTAAYRGNQPGHDNYKRSDSHTPTQSYYNPSASSYGSMGASSYAAQSSYASQPSFTAQTSTYAPQSAQSFHLANYRGDQPGHDNYKRSDSQTPTQSQYGGAGFASGMNQYQPSFTSSFAQSAQQYQSPQSFHTANYRGDQPGHDAYKRSDSSTPTSFATANFGGFAR